MVFNSIAVICNGYWYKQCFYLKLINKQLANAKHPIERMKIGIGMREYKLIWYKFYPITFNIYYECIAIY